MSIMQTIKAALEAGALCPAQTKLVKVHENGITYSVRQFLQLAEKKSNGVHTISQKSFVNPFLPHEKKLEVKQLPGDYLCLLNKFNVCDLHLLVIPAGFEHQGKKLSLDDFRAWTEVFQMVQDLETSQPDLQPASIIGFYNCGQKSGTSQPHKHMQVCRLETPILDHIQQTCAQQPSASIFKCDGLAFAHRVAKIDHLFGFNDHPGLSPLFSFAGLHQMYLDMAKSLGIQLRTDNYTENHDPRYYPLDMDSYNLIFDKNFMLMVPRGPSSLMDALKKHTKHNIDPNALAYTGNFLAKSSGDIDLMKEAGFMNILTSFSAQK